MSPDAHSASASKETSLIPTPQAERNSLSPADCRTLKKIIDDVQGPSPATSASQSDEDANGTGVNLAGEESSDTGCEDEVTYIGEQHSHGDEASDGYADEDKSMELSDGDLTPEEQKAEFVEQAAHEVDSDDEEAYVWSDGDTIEDIMNVPGNTAPPARQQDLVGIHVRDQPLSTENKIVKEKRVAIKEALEAERLEHEHQESVAQELGLTQATSKHGGDTINLLDDPEIRAAEANRAETGMAITGDETGGIELEDINPSTRRQTQIFSPKSTSRQPIRGFGSKPPVLAPNFSDDRPAVIQTPSGKHLDFTSSAAVNDTPFSKTLNYFKQHKGKENSPSKSRRNASLPEEIAQVAKEAKEADEEEEDLEKYREMDLAPMEPVTEDESSGDLITLGSPVKSNTSTPGTTGILLDLSEQNAIDTEEDSNYKMSDLILVPKANTVADLVDVHPLSSTAVAQSSPLVSEHDPDGGADADRSESTYDEGDRRLILAPEQPAFAKVIELLPEVMFWQVAAPVARYSNQAYEALVEKFHDLGL